MTQAKKTTEATLTGYDSVASDVAGWHQVVPVTNPQVIGSYRNGRYANDTSAKQAFPKAFHFDYDVHGSLPEADDLDIEKSDAVPAQAPGWARKWQKIKIHALPLPALYESASDVSTVVSVMLDAGFKREDFLIDSAHFNFEPHICGPHTCGYPQADKTQHSDKGPHGENVDISLISGHFIGKVAKPRHDPHYGWFDTTKRVIFGGRTEVQLVREYDRWRATQSANHHPHRARLAVLRAQLWLGTKRLSKMNAMEKLHPYHRVWRERELRERAQGKRLV